MISNKKKFLAVSLMVLAISCSACGKNDNSADNQNINVTSVAVQIKDGDRELQFDKFPTRLVTLRQHITETALAIDLDKYIVGTAAVIDPPVAPEYAERYAKLHVIAEKYPSPEVLFEANPDLIWVDRKWAFVKNQLGSMANIEDHGIKIYLSESGFHKNNDISYVYDDINRMGKIFRTEEKATAVIKMMQTKIADVQKQIGNPTEKVTVMDYDNSRNNMAFVGCKCMADELIKLAGGQNVFDDIDKEWATINWEEVMRRNPDVIVIHEYRGVKGEDKIKALKAKEVLQDVNAIKNNRFVIVNLDEIYEGVRNAETVEKLAKGFYPEKF